MDDILLMAYVDGELSPNERKELERAIRTSADVARRFELFEASVLPYQLAFQHQDLPPVPESLTRMIAGIAQAYAGPSGISVVSHATAPASQTDAQGSPSAAIRCRHGDATTWISAAFVAGAFCSGAALRLVPPYTQSGGAQSGTPVATQPAASAWLMAAVDDQRLYTRDTVAFDTPTLAVAAQTADKVRHDDGIAIRVPDLRSVGLTFKRIQRLRYNNQALVQIVYLAEKGSPVALCVVKDEKPDTALAERQIDGMAVLTWRHAYLGYALIARPGDANFAAIGKRISESSVEEMLGEMPDLYQSHAG